MADARTGLALAGRLGRRVSRAWVRRYWRVVSRAVSGRLTSSLTRRIVFLNLGGLFALAAGFLYLNQFREGLIDARVQSLQAQGEIVAAAIAASAAVETDTLTLDPEKLLQEVPTATPDDAENSLEFSINPERIGPVLRRLVGPTRTRARVFDRDGFLLLDSRALAARPPSPRSEAPPPAGQAASQVADEPTLIERSWNAVKHRFDTAEPPVNDDTVSGNGRALPEVAHALAGTPSSVVRVSTRGETVISVGVPIQRFRAVEGALLMSTQGGDLDKIISGERWSILRIFLAASAVMFALSLLLANTIAGPMQRLAVAAERVRHGIKSRQEIPDFTHRTDEIGHLSGALRDMTGALYSRLDAIETFAADVAHELKNPLTSLRSAVETLPLARTNDARDRLLGVIQHDVKRLDRLISDISDASRLDAELARADTVDVDLAQLVPAVVAMSNEMGRKGRAAVDVAIVPDRAGAFVVRGHESRLGQVLVNLVDNARSFSPAGGSVRVRLARVPAHPAAGGAVVEITVDDDGPGIPAHAFERIFERFYTDRPDQGFGQNSGLGLSISRQIVEAHGGRVWAANRTRAAPEPTRSGSIEAGCAEADVLGARFVVRLPAT